MYTEPPPTPTPPRRPGASLCLPGAALSPAGWGVGWRNGPPGAIPGCDLGRPSCRLMFCSLPPQLTVSRGPSPLFPTQALTCGSLCREGLHLDGKLTSVPQRQGGLLTLTEWMGSTGPPGRPCRWPGVSMSAVGSPAVSPGLGWVCSTGHHCHQGCGWTASPPTRLPKPRFSHLRNGHSRVGGIVGVREGQGQHGWPWTLLVLTPEMGGPVIGPSAGGRLCQAQGSLQPSSRRPPVPGAELTGRAGPRGLHIRCPAFPGSWSRDKGQSVWFSSGGRL